MNICGIIAEFDPLHCGHIYLLRQIRKRCCGVVVVMSGHATQRGEISKFDKWSRAKAALLYGADLVIELPTLYSCLSAEHFANSSIFILSKLGVVKNVCFGSELGNIDILSCLASQSLNIEKREEFKKLLKLGYNYPLARRALLGEPSSPLDFPNNTLGVEYIKASLLQNVNLNFFTIKRLGFGHDDLNGLGSFSQFVSSSFIRNDPKRVFEFLPSDIASLFSCHSKVDEKILLYRLKSMSKHEFSLLPDVSEGLENRLYSAAIKASSLNDFISLVKTKRYTYSRIKRIILYSLLGIKKDNLILPPPYARVLGFNQLGRKILKDVNNKSDIFVSPSFKTIYKKFYEVARFDVVSTDIFNLGLDSKPQFGLDFKKKVILPNDLIE